MKCIGYSPVNNTVHFVHCQSYQQLTEHGCLNTFHKVHCLVYVFKHTKTSPLPVKHFKHNCFSGLNDGMNTKIRNSGVENILTHIYHVYCSRGLHPDHKHGEINSEISEREGFGRERLRFLYFFFDEV